MEYEKKYWDYNGFRTSDGKDYQGYVGIYDNQGYIFDTGEPLIKKDSYLTQFNSSGKFFDRLLHEDLQLPYTKKEIQFQANDFLYHTTIREILKKLQANNDYIYQQATISDTLIPAVDDCSIFATDDSSYYVFEDNRGNQWKQLPTSQEEFEVVSQKLASSFIDNPNFDKSKEERVYQLKIGEVAKRVYPSVYSKIPKTNLVVNLNNGILKRYNLSTKSSTRTALDPTFYSQEQGVEPLFNFDEIVASDSIITQIGMDANGNKRVKLILFLAFKTKIVVCRFILYPDNFQAQQSDDEYSYLDFRDENSKDILVIDTIDPANLSSLKFLDLSDMRVKGHHLYCVDKTLNMLVRYDIGGIANEDGYVTWDKKSLRLLDILQGDGKVNSQIYFNAPVSVDADDDFVYVADSKNKCIKKYSSSLDYVATIKNGSYAQHDIQRVQVNPYGFDLYDGTHIAPNSLWIFSVNAKNLHLSIVSNGRLVYSRPFSAITINEDRYSWDEKFKTVKFSFSNSNYFYVVTTKRVYKVHMSKPHYPFASLSYFKQRVLLSSMIWGQIPYKWHALPAGENDDTIDVTWNYHAPSTSAEILDNKAFCLIGCDSTEPCDEKGTQKQFDGDIIFHVGTLYNQSKVDTYCKRHNCKFSDIPKDELKDMIKCSGVFLYNETTSYLTSTSKLNFACFTSDEINEMDSEEYVNPITFNKMMYKVIFNLINIKNVLLGKYWGYYNLDGLMVFDQMEYDDYFQNMRIEKSDDFFIHDNEPTSIVINRIFEKVYDLQEKFLNHMQTKYRAQGAFTNNSFKVI